MYDKIHYKLKKIKNKKKKGGEAKSNQEEDDNSFGVDLLPCLRSVW